MTVESVRNSQINTTLNGTRSHICHTFLFFFVLVDKRMNREFYNLLKIVHSMLAAVATAGVLWTTNTNTRYFRFAHFSIIFAICFVCHCLSVGDTVYGVYKYIRSF